GKAAPDGTALQKPLHQPRVSADDQRSPSRSPVQGKRRPMAPHSKSRCIARAFPLTITDW
ncbi:MAG: hypothetical protein ACKO38_19975, partial [Planctomycetota bacterium]